MKLLSQIFQPVLTIPKNAKVKSTEITCISQKLLLECGLVRPTGSGLFTLLPLARRALQKLELLARRCVEEAGAQCVSLPTLTSRALWERSGRLERCREELLLVEDRHRKGYVLAPTHEEAVADLLADVSPLSYKQLPLVLYQVSNKYRDEHRPKHGLLRAREFLMLDAYGAHAGEGCARDTYRQLGAALRALYAALHLPVYTVEAPVGEMGGSLSHEWHVAAGAGEDRLAVCGGCGAARLSHTADTSCRECRGVVEEKNTIEVGHTFILGTQYSEALGANYTTSEGTQSPVVMSCYGVGLTRLLCAALEAGAAAAPAAPAAPACLRWPRAIAPYALIVIGPKEGSHEWSGGGAERARQVCAAAEAEPALGGDVVLDDRHHLTIGRRMKDADRVGYPMRVVCGKLAAGSPPRYELSHAGRSPTQLLTLPELMEAIVAPAPEDTLTTAA